MAIYTWVLYGMSNNLKDVPSQATVTRVNDREVAGVCEGCQKFIYADESWYITGDDVYLCVKCGKDLSA